jgi:hypothetical protein
MVSASRLAQSRYYGAVLYDERLREYGLSETKNSIAARLKRGTFAATFLLAVLAALEMEGVRLEDL